MDPSRLAITFAVLMIGYGLGRFVVASLSRAGDGMAALFVPPDRALGWPLGVQEGDEPWGWRSGRPITSPADRPADPDDGSPGVAHEAVDGPAHGAFVVPVGRLSRSPARRRSH